MLEALHRLISEHLAHREVLAFIAFEWRPDSLDEPSGGARWLPYDERWMPFLCVANRRAFFGSISPPGSWDRNLHFISLRPGRCGAPRQRVARAGMAAVIEKFF